MDGYNDAVMVALLPVDGSWSVLELPHMTLVYAGKIDELVKSAHNELAKSASSIAVMSRPVHSRVWIREEFGKNDERVDVYRLQYTPQIYAMRRVVEGWDASEWPFNPHVTIGPVGTPSEQPPYITFDRILVAWGNDHLVFPLSG